MNRDKILQILKSTGALAEGHYRLSGGRHSPQYLKCECILRRPLEMGKLSKLLAGTFPDDERPDRILGRGLTGGVLAYEMARKLHAEPIFAGEDESGPYLRPGFSVLPGDAVVVVDDVVTTGRAMHLLMSLVLQEGGEIPAVGALVDRSEESVQFGVPFRSLVRLEIPEHAPAQCPLCRRGVPLETL